VPRSLRQAAASEEAGLAASEASDAPFGKGKRDFAGDEMRCFAIFASQPAPVLGWNVWE